MLAQSSVSDDAYDRYFKPLTNKIAEKKALPEALLKKMNAHFKEKAAANPYGEWASAARLVIQTELPDTAVFAHLYQKEIRTEAVRQAATGLIIRVASMEYSWQ